MQELTHRRECPTGAHHDERRASSGPRLGLTRRSSSNQLPITEAVPQADAAPFGSHKPQPAPHGRQTQGTASPAPQSSVSCAAKQRRLRLRGADPAPAAAACARVQATDWRLRRLLTRAAIEESTSVAQHALYTDTHMRARAATAVAATGLAVASSKQPPRPAQPPPSAQSTGSAPAAPSIPARPRRPLATEAPTAESCVTGSGSAKRLSEPSVCLSQASVEGCGEDLRRGADHDGAVILEAEGAVHACPDTPRPTRHQIASPRASRLCGQAAPGCRVLAAHGVGALPPPPPPPAPEAPTN